MNLSDIKDWKKDIPCKGWRSRTTIGRFEVSIICGEFFYSSPREFLDDPMLYSKYEAALFFDGEWAHPKDHGLDSPDINWEEGDGATVGGYITRESLEAFLAAIENLK